MALVVDVEDAGKGTGGQGRIVTIKRRSISLSVYLYSSRSVLPLNN